ncbi:hypothetical protein CC1G_12262 [Coprinopsis cinerea okayama7|uniref:pyranose dehydrogenase (acceptor) n=1 Tax=Coprinopsis cinerea (strain Okayama-7 / 130 / ATCC MYA-4618 / FGSC 9003) TaxID=240176 RepID=A8NSV9_COPC7|nr:hypothetical protein CC1G_12262 [Coprinopsis cinerea okayama7\|eukprot:XP_001836103.1 hypothetical protein CC1G_12262 [Coprinopsis cinerea okayama7\
MAFRFALLQFVLLAQLLITPACAVIVDSFAALPANTTYDFVIVGGGNSGAVQLVKDTGNPRPVLAHRLSSNPRWKVLVIEAGPTHESEDAFRTRVPGFTFSLERTIHDWNFTSTPQAGLNNREVPLFRGHILGGSSSINGMFYTRGSAADYDRWARVTGDKGWSWRRMVPYIKRSEKWTEPADGHDTTGRYNPSVHGNNGLVSVSIVGYSQAIDDAVIDASAELGGDFSYDVDVNDGNQLGVGWVQATVGNGERSSAATSYLAPQYANRPNLHILVNHRVTRLVTSGMRKGVPSLRTVQFAPRNSPGSPVMEVTAKKEVILSAGAYGTPQILLLSGVGNPSELQAKGITPVVDLPGVGKNMTDHPMLIMPWAVGIPGTIVPTPELQEQWLDEWNTSKTGPLTILGINHNAWIRIPPESDIWNDFEDPSSGEHTPHVEFGIIGGAMQSAPPPVIMSSVIPVQPLSRGSVTLASSDPFADPVIDSGVLTSPFDMFTFKYGISEMKRFFNASAWQEYNLTLAEVPEDEDDWDEWIRNVA